MTKDSSESRPPSVWVFTICSAGIALAPFINVALGDPISGQMNAMLFVAAVAIPAVSTMYLAVKPTIREKIAVPLTFLFGAGTLFWVDWARLDGRVFALAAFFFIPTLVRLGTRSSS